MGNKYSISNKDSAYYITFATVGWVDVFTRKVYCDMIIENLRYCQEHKGLIIYSWCLMSNHIHMVVEAKHSNLSEILRDFKSYTAKQIFKAIQEEPESRREWMLKIFEEAGKQNSNNLHFQFWQQDNHYVEVRTKDFAFQKIGYMHRNPVESGILEKEEEYLYSSARDYFYGKQCGLLKIQFWDE